MNAKVKKIDMNSYVIIPNGGLFPGRIPNKLRRGLAVL